jgi:hypothetical protein
MAKIKTEALKTLNNQLKTKKAGTRLMKRRRGRLAMVIQLPGKTMINHKRGKLVKRRL